MHQGSNPSVSSRRDAVVAAVGAAMTLVVVPAGLAAGLVCVAYLHRSRAPGLRNALLLLMLVVGSVWLLGAGPREGGLGVDR